MSTIVFGTVRPLPRKRRIFRWRNYLRAGPVISQKPDSPMRILNTKYNSSDSPVKPRGVQAGLQAAADHLLGVFEREGAASVLETLPKIHVNVSQPMSPRPDPELGIFGFYSGVTRAKVSLEHVYRQRGIDAIGPALIQILQEGKP